MKEKPAAVQPVVRVKENNWVKKTLAQKILIPITVAKVVQMALFHIKPLGLIVKAMMEIPSVMEVEIAVPPMVTIVVPVAVYWKCIGRVPSAVNQWATGRVPSAVMEAGSIINVVIIL